MKRIHVIGVSGVRKSTLAKGLSQSFRYPYLELDAVHHQRDWAPIDQQEFRRTVEQFCSGSSWVICGNYSQVRDLIWARADTVVWLDLPRWRVMKQIVFRSLKRVIFRETLWNGNRESWAGLLSLDPKKSVMMWAWTRHGSYRKLYEREFSRLKEQGLACVHLRSSKEVRNWLAGLKV